MKQLLVVLSLVAVCFFANGVFAGNKAVISNNVDAIVAEIDAGKMPTSYNANDYAPYAFIFEEDGQMLVHPSLVGKNLKEVAAPIYEVLTKATPEGVWVEYEWKGKQKHTYTKKTKSNLIVASGY